MTDFKDVITFLENNGFKCDKPDYYPINLINDKCVVIIHDYGYEVQDENGSMFSKGHLIYWLIGVLTYYGYMDKNYKQ